MSKKAIFSKRIARELTLKGFKIVGTGINNKFPQYLVYFFENTEELIEALENLTKPVRE